MVRPAVQQVDGDVDELRPDELAERLRLRVLAGALRDTATEQAVHDEVQRPQVREAVALDVQAVGLVGQQRPETRFGEIGVEPLERRRAPGEQPDVGGPALVAGASADDGAEWRPARLAIDECRRWH